MSVFGSLQKTFVADLFRKAFRVAVINPENEPLGEDVKSYVACINHMSNWDPIIIGACMHRPLRFMAKSELFKVPVLGWLVKLFGAFPVKRNTADVLSIKTSINLLENGEVVGIYPEGHRAKKTPPSYEVPLKSGVAMAAMRAKTGILPVTIITKGYKVRMFRKTIVVFGEHVPYEKLEGFAKECGEISNVDLYKKITDKIYGDILENYKKYDTLNKK